MRPEWAADLCVWEVTLACNARCVHCGSDAGKVRPSELSPQEAIELCDALARIGVRHVTLSGGEPLMRQDWPALVRRLVGHGLRVEMITNGLCVDEAAAHEIAGSGLASVTLSIDGTEEVHDELRGVPGAWRLAKQAVASLRAQGLQVGAVTQVNRANLGCLAEIEQTLVEWGIGGWQLQLTVPMGRCEQHPELALEPAEVPAVMDFILGSSRPIPLYAADNIGWMLPSEPRIRSANRPTDRFYAGCQAGLRVIGITSDGTVRGCLSMPPEFNEGNVRLRPLEEIWNDPKAFAYNRCFRQEELSGACAACAFRRICRAGCKTIAFASTGQTSHNPFCALALDSAQVRARLR
ncbi:MAG: radical SAM protein [Deltaproteobacteria bacterium]|nr:radical SAM protein [Deltaproteobacteria bacterium]